MKTQSIGAARKEVGNGPELAIVLAEVPYSTGRGTKVRPFLVWRDCGWDCWGFPLTGQAPRSEFEVSLTEWWQANLHGPGTVRVGSGCPVAKQRIGRVLGRLSRADARKIAKAVATLLVVDDNQFGEQEPDLALA